jgi:hypothetical protein
MPSHLYAKPGLDRVTVICANEGMTTATGLRTRSVHYGDWRAMSEPIAVSRSSARWMANP